MIFTIIMSFAVLADLRLTVAHFYLAGSRLSATRTLIKFCTYTVFALLCFLLIERDTPRILIAIDTSLSMAGKSLPPHTNRLDEAKSIALSLLDQIEQGANARVALGVIEESLSIEVPATVDYALIRQQITRLEVGYNQEYGTNLSSLTKYSNASYVNANYSNIILISDGDTQNADSLADTSDDTKINTFKVGIPSSVSIVNKFIKNGAISIPNTFYLKRLASVSSGHYERFDSHVNSDRDFLILAILGIFALTSFYQGGLRLI